MAIQVKSEIGKLRRVLLQRPGLELDHLIPGALERLLFDDIPYLHGAQQEHDRFAETLRACGAEVVYLADLAAETIAQDDAIKEQFVRDFIHASGCIAENYADELREFLLGISDPRELILKTMAGVEFTELAPRMGNSLAAFLHDKSDFALDPIPNLYFTRDPFAAIGTGVTLHHMYSVTRNRETIYGRYILQYHKDYAGKVPFYYLPDDPFTLEGGDILNLSNRVLAVGISQRTMPEAIERLARSLFADESCEIDTVLALGIPSKRAFMHLDTVLTQADYDTFIIHPIILESLRIFELKPAAKGGISVRELSTDLQQTLRDYLGLDKVTLIRCGGFDDIAAQREQWNDGSNTLCVAPGVVIAYDRNHVTNRLLEDHGIQVLKIPSGELSRGRGGPRCMSMPLCRDPLPR